MKKTIAATAVLMACCMVLAAWMPVSAKLRKKSDVPSVSAFSKADLQGQLITFTAEDFTSRICGNEELSAIVLSDLPTAGRLTLAGQNLQLGQAVEAERLGALCYIPEIGEEIHTSFSFLPVFSKSGAGEACVNVSLNISDTPNSAPIAVAKTYETYADMTVCGTLMAVDPDGDACSFEIVSQGTKGEAEVTEAGFLYRPSGKTGQDSFSYLAVDPYGNRSQPAEVTVSILKRAAKENFTYTDMSMQTAHFAAIRLREAGVFSGETIGTDAFFCPDKPVTRTEFLAITARLADLPMPTAAVSTGMSDQETIPVWAQSYVSAGLTSGVVTGIADGLGNRAFHGENPITRGEAAVILDRALHLPQDGRPLNFADASDVPDWSAQAVRNTTAAGILPVFADRTVRTEELVTRADAAMMLYETMQYQKR